MSVCSGCQENGCYQSCSSSNCNDSSTICGTYFQNQFDSTTQNLVTGLYTLENSGQLGGDSANGIFNRIVSFGLLTAMTSCQSSFLVNQNITIDCNNPVDGENVVNNANCTACKKGVAQWLADRQTLDEEAHKRNSNYTIPHPDPTLLSQIRGAEAPSLSWNGVGNHGICKYVCDQCVAEGIDQSANVHISASCDVSSQQFRSAFVRGLTAQAEAEIIKHENKINKVLQGLKSQKDVKSLSSSFSNSVLQTATDTLLRELHSQALLYQGVIVQPGSTSVVLSNVKQTITADILSSITSRFYTNTTVTSLANYASLKDDLQEIVSLSDFLNEIEADVQTLVGLLKTTLGKILITLLAILFTVVIGIASLFFFKPKLIFGGIDLNPA